MTTCRFRLAAEFDGIEGVTWAGCALLLGIPVADLAAWLGVEASAG